MPDNLPRLETHSAVGGQSITTNSANAGFGRSRGIFIGTSASYDFSLDGTNWITFQGCIAGTILSVEALGARITSGSAAPTAGDVVFLY